MYDDYNEEYRFGSAGFVESDELRQAGFFESQDNSLFIGFHGRKPLLWNGAGGSLLVAGARAGKLRDYIAYQVCSLFYKNSMLVLDMKGEIAAMFARLAHHALPSILWNPAGLHGLPQHRINPVDYITIDSPSLVSDVKIFCQNILPKSGSNNAVFFEERGQAFLEAIILTITKMDGVLTMPRLYEFINLIPGNSEEWLNFAFEMHESGFPIARSVEEEIAASRGSDGGGFRGILGEVMKSVAPLSDPMLMTSVSPPFTASMADLCGNDPMQLFLMPPAEFVEAWSVIIKALFVAGMIYKSRAPQAPPQTWILDECAQLGTFPLVTRIFTYGAGIGIRPQAVYQSLAQAKATGPDAQNIIPASAAVQIYFGVRDYGTAQHLSNMLGVQTLEFDQDLQRQAADLARKQAVQAILGGDDPFSAGLEYAHHKKASQHRTKQSRNLRTSDEILNMPGDTAYVFADGLSGAIEAERKPHFEHRAMAGRYLPNPYHPPLDKVRVKTRFGHSSLRVIKERVGAQSAHYPQYADGYWTRLEG